MAERGAEGYATRVAASSTFNYSMCAYEVLTRESVCLSGMQAQLVDLYAPTDSSRCCSMVHASVRGIGLRARPGVDMAHRVLRTVKKESEQRVWF